MIEIELFSIYTKYCTYFISFLFL